MKNVLQIFIVGIVLTMTTNVFAQTFGIRAGLNLANQVWKANGETFSDDFKMNPGFHVGGTVDLPISDVFSFETGLILSTKGFRSSDEDLIDGEEVKIETTLNLFYLDIPLTAKASIDLGGAKIYGLFGPYIGLGLSGKTKLKASADGVDVSVEEDVTWSNDNEEDARRLDYGLAFGAGVEIKAFQIGLNYGLGLANISNFEGDSKVNNRVLGISLGYRFGL